MNLGLRRHRDDDGTMSYIIDVRYMTEDEMQRWMKGEPIRSVEESKRSFSPDNQNA
ncbi:MAG: hypothetical protein ACP5T9_06455 [Thermoplasmata archaeon]